MKTRSVKNYNALNTLESLIEKYSKQYRNIETFAIDNDIFITRPLTRKEFKDINSNPVMSDIEKKDMICKTCILYPPNFDLDNCIASLPDELYEKIIDQSCIRQEDISELITIFRKEMEYIDNQMACIIVKAFPAYKIDEVENLDMIEFCRLFSKAEWVINNITENAEIIDLVEAINNIDETPAKQNKENTEEHVQVKEVEHTPTKPQRDENVEYDLPDTSLDDKPISRMTPEQRQAMDDFYRRYPQFDKSTDYAYTGRIPHEYKDPPALRPNWGRRK